VKERVKLIYIIIVCRPYSSTILYSLTKPRMCSLKYDTPKLCLFSPGFPPPPHVHLSPFILTLNVAKWMHHSPQLVKALLLAAAGIALHGTLCFIGSVPGLRLLEFQSIVSSKAVSLFGRAVSSKLVVLPSSNPHRLLRGG